MTINRYMLAKIGKFKKCISLLLCILISFVFLFFQGCVPASGTTNNEYEENPN